MKCQKQKDGGKAFQKCREHGGKKTVEKREIEKERERERERERKKEKKNEVELNFHLKI
jgi:hypothetical protein